MDDDKEIKDLAEQILTDYDNGRAIDKMELYNQPDKDAIVEILDKLISILLPGYYRDHFYKIYDPKKQLYVMIEDAIYRLTKQVSTVLPYSDEFEDLTENELNKKASELTKDFFSTIPKIREYLDTDLEAILQGDPAARNKDEIILCYPGFYAITVYRLAHEMFVLGIPMIPRIMTEHAHSLTGIDIHPGATIGKYFCIDHGTGIVIGETTVIGERVKIYQGVTLGALSTRGGQQLKGVRRHPTIGDYVTIYAGASVLGGDSVIGNNCVIGSNVFITSSVPAGTSMSVKSQELKIRHGEGQPDTEVEFEQKENWNDEG